MSSSTYTTSPYVYAPTPKGYPGNWTHTPSSPRFAPTSLIGTPIKQEEDDQQSNSSDIQSISIKDEHQPRNILYDISDIDGGAFTATNFEGSYPPEDYNWDVNGRRSSSG
jgi:hypothetical protein